MTNYNSKKITKLIEDFLIETPCPVTSDWKCLIDLNPECAGAIADAAIAYSLTEGDEINMQIPFNEKAFNSTISHVLNRVHTTPSPMLMLAEEKVKLIQGASVRNVAQEIGIGSYVQLLNGVLVGRILAPKQILIRLAERLEVSIAALSELFYRRFAASEVPAFKSPDGKPQVKLKPSTWEQAVKAIDLPEDEITRLLKLAEEE